MRDETKQNVEKSVLHLICIAIKLAMFEIINRHYHQNHVIKKL
jgi:hypothetical protein